ncbi:MAG: hypothetical protein H6684_00720 [Deltaproteobacteria bacterium]|nr:hypothetical protein [bacterium]MCB9478215.1 hypothetical protein [Deltaproteobacteria bacterium]MCB9487232.1 hypothetical protein [Deltaproteobacteria bacterium]
MKLVIDGQNGAGMELHGGVTFGEVIDEARRAGVVKDDQVVIAAMIDGRPVDPTTPESLDSTVGNEGRIELQTVSSVDLLCGSVHDGREAIEQLVESCHQTADKYRAENLVDASLAFSALSDQIIQVVRYVDDLTPYLPADDGQTDALAELHARFHDVLSEAVGFQKDADWVMLADVVDYEFPEVFGRFDQLLADYETALAVVR